MYVYVIIYNVHCVFRFMARKLYVFASGQCMAESSDSPMNQEILLGGHFSVKGSFSTYVHIPVSYAEITLERYIEC